MPERAGVAIENIEVLAGYCLLQERHDGRPALSILRLAPPDAPGQGMDLRPRLGSGYTLTLLGESTGAVHPAPAAHRCALARYELLTWVRFIYTLIC